MVAMHLINLLASKEMLFPSPSTSSSSQILDLLGLLSTMAVLAYLASLF